MHINGTHISRILISPYQIQQILPAVDLVRVLNQKFQHVKLFCSQIHFSVTYKYPAALAVQTQISHCDGTGALCLFLIFLGPAHDGLDAGLHLQYIERLGDIVICTVFQPQDLIHVFTLGSQHNDGNLGKFTDLLAHFKTCHLWKHNIQQDHVIAVLPGLLQRFLPVICTVHFHIILLQTETDSLYDQLLIINNQNSFTHLIISSSLSLPVIQDYISIRNIVFYFLVCLTFDAGHLLNLFHR